MNSFERLALPVKLDLSELGIREAYRLQAVKYHPDAGGSPEIFLALGEAQVCLLSPAKRLREWMKIQQLELEERGSIDSELMDLFTKIAELTQKAEHLIKESELARSILTQKLAEVKRMECREAIQSVLQEVNLQLQNRVFLFTDIEQNIGNFALIYRNLIFLEKWRDSLRSLFSRLI